MPKLNYQSRDYDNRAGETVLDTALRNGLPIPFSCRSGICQVCLQRCTAGELPEEAQHGLKPELRAKGYFLPCRCLPVADMAIAPPCESDLYTSAVVSAKRLLAPDIVQLLLEPAGGFSARAGQFINLRALDGTARSYSLAANPETDYFLELHVKRMPGGRLSNWILDELQPGDTVEIQGPQGRGYYAASHRAQPLLLIATGTGLAPLLGTARDALANGHGGEIFLYHGSRHPQGLYLREALLELSAHHQNFHYTGCLSGPERVDGTVSGRAHEVALSLHEQLRGWRVHLAGRPEMVRAAEALALRAGAAPGDVFADPFELTDRRRQQRAGAEATTGRRAEPAPDPEMWQALGEGALLNRILSDFYTQVFADLRLAPYFRGVTRQRLIEKVYSFMHQIFTGTKCYFGDRPRNAHHWMVIPDELFDHRERLMTDTLARYGLAPHLIERWHAIEESFRPDIVKDRPWPRVVGGVELPVDGYGEVVLEVGSICDGCQTELGAGTAVRYHLRLGTTYCRQCHGG